MIKDNLANLKNEIATVCERIGRDPKDVVLIGVTKYSEVPAIKEAILAGLTDIGENRVQDGREKFPLLDELTGSARKYMIGHLQTNKVKLAVELFDMIQSIDSEKVAAEVDKHCAKAARKMDVLVQVNVAGEEQKSGTDTVGAKVLTEKILEMKNLRFCGLMTIAPLTEDKELIRDTFRKLRLLGDELKQEHAGKSRFEMKYLSMGMTDDYRIALEEGSNMLRIGRAIFGG